MRRTILLLTTMTLTLLVVSGAALAVNKIGTNGRDILVGTNGDDDLLGKGGNDDLFSLAGNDDLLGGTGKDFCSVVINASRPPAARSTWWEVPSTI